jgi:hypothetical protein
LIVEIGAVGRQLVEVAGADGGGAHFLLLIVPLLLELAAGLEHGHVILDRLERALLALGCGEGFCFVDSRQQFGRSPTQDCLGPNG